MADADSQRPGWKEEPGSFTPIDTPAGFLARGESLTLYCSGARCHHHQDVDLAALVERGLGDEPIEAVRRRAACRVCGARLPQMIRGGFGEGPGCGR